MESGGEDDREFGGDSSAGDTSADDIETLPTQTRKRKGRGPAKFKSKPGQPKIIDEWGYNDQPIGPESNSFVSDLGNLVRARVNINVKSWRHVSDELKKQMWEEITRDYVIDESKRKIVLQKMCKLHRNFKNMLRRKYINKTEPIPNDKVNEPPYETYKNFTKEDWLEFVAYSQTHEFEELSKKNSENSKKNQYPHLMGRRGYAKSIPMWENTGLVNKFSTDTDSASSSGVKSGEYPRHIYWFCARVGLDSENNVDYPSSQMVGAHEKLNEVTDDIANGKFIPEGANDILSAVVGPDRCGRAKGFGGHKGYSHYFGRKKGRSVGQEKNSVSRLELETYKSEIKAQYDEQLESLKDDFSRQLQEVLAKAGMVGCSKPPNASSSPVTSREYRESVHSRVHEPTSSFVDGAKCSLALRTNGNVKIVAKAQAYNAKIMHTVPIMAGHVKVSVNLIVQKFRELQVPVPVEGVLLLDNAVGSFLQWPRDLVFFEGEEPLASSHDERCYGKKRKSLGTRVNPREDGADNKYPLATKDILEKLSTNDLMLHDMLELLEPQYCQFSIPLPKEMFNYTSDDFTTIINREDLGQYFNGESLNISMIQGFLLHLSRKMKDTGVTNIGFLCPEICSRTSLNYDKVTTRAYLTRAFKNSFDKNLILLPYNESNHWILIAICPHTWKGYLFDPLYTEPETKKYDLVDLKFPFKVAAMNNGVRNATLSFEKVKCRKQPRPTECGYYVMRYMHEIINLKIQNIGTEWRTNETSYSTMELNEIRDEWARYFVDFISD